MAAGADAERSNLAGNGGRAVCELAAAGGDADGRLRRPCGISSFGRRALGAAKAAVCLTVVCGVAALGLAAGGEGVEPPADPASALPRSLATYPSPTSVDQVYMFKVSSLWPRDVEVTMVLHLEPKRWQLDSVFKTILSKTNLRSVSDLSVYDRHGNAVEHRTSDKNGYYKVSTFEGRPGNPLSMKYNIQNAICHDANGNEQLIIDWTGWWKIPVTFTSYLLEFDEGIADVRDLCHHSDMGKECGITSYNMGWGSKIEVTADANLKNSIFVWPKRASNYMQGIGDAKSWNCPTDLGTPNYGTPDKWNGDGQGLGIGEIIALVMFLIAFFVGCAFCSVKFIKWNRFGDAAKKRGLKSASSDGSSDDSGW